MGDVVRGSLDGRGLRVAVVQSRFNESVTDALLQGALESLREMAVGDADVRACSVPGAVEIPLVALHLARGGQVDAVVAVGAVIRGETPHFEYVCRMVADGCLRVSLDTGVPIGFGVITCDDADQAFARAGAGEENKGRAAARAAVEAANLLRGREA